MSKLKFLTIPPNIYSKNKKQLKDEPVNINQVETIQKKAWHLMLSLQSVPVCLSIFLSLSRLLMRTYEPNTDDPAFLYTSKLMSFYNHNRRWLPYSHSSGDITVQLTNGHSCYQWINILEFKTAQRNKATMLTLSITFCPTHKHTHTVHVLSCQSVSLSVCLCIMYIMFLREGEYWICI